jgi:type VI secretion system protein ImpC
MDRGGPGADRDAFCPRESEIYCGYLSSARPFAYLRTGASMNPDPTRRTGGVLGDVRLAVDLGRVVAATPRSDEPFRIGILGDFRGRGDAPGDAAGPAERRPVPVDRDNLDDVLARFAPELRLSLADDAPEVTVRFEELDDFHPDRLLERLPLFRSLRDLRRRLADPSTFRSAAAELWGAGDAPAPAPSAPPAGSAQVPPGGSLLDMIVGEAPDTPPPPVRDDLATYIRRIVAPHVVADDHPRQAEALVQVDAAIGGQMRAILHHPRFQALESLWRGVHFLVRRVETGARLRIELIDCTRAELESAPAHGDDVSASAVERLVLESGTATAGAAPWSLLVGDFVFGPRPDDLRLLRRMGRLARQAGAPWICAADPGLVGSPSFGDAADPDLWTLPVSAEWDELRHAPEAAHLGLVLPRFLLRLPYGEESDPCDTFRFEEMTASAGHEHFLWGNPALACALLLARGFAEEGWAMGPGAQREIGGLPLHLVKRGGEIRVTQCAEAPMSERAAERIAAAGLMPLASVRDRDAAILVRIGSIAASRAPLAGRWAHAG